jgi:Flp pilus assembly protein TadG
LKAFLRCERGTQLLEFALLFPFLLLLFASAVEMGRMFYTYTTLQKSTEVGARFLSSRPVTGGNYTTGDVNTATNLIVCGVASSAANGCSSTPAVALNLTNANVTVTSPGTAVGTRYVTVTLTYAYQPLMFDLSHLTGSSQNSLNFTFTPSMKMRYML